MRSFVKRFVLKLYDWRLINIGRARRIINQLGVNDA